jgi:succinyl-diaminopimelate desuccinylase
VIEFGLAGATMHKVDENVAIADILQLSDIYERILDSYFHAQLD